MPKMRDYRCKTCGHSFEFLHQPSDEVPYCLICSSEELELVPCGGHVFTVTVVGVKATRASRAGYQHLYQNRPAEKISVSIPRTVFKGAAK